MGQLGFEAGFEAGFQLGCSLHLNNIIILNFIEYIL